MTIEQQINDLNEEIEAAMAAGNQGAAEELYRELEELTADL